MPLGSQCDQCKVLRRALAFGPVGSQGYVFAWHPYIGEPVGESAYNDVESWQLVLARYLGASRMVSALAVEVQVGAPSSLAALMAKWWAGRLVAALGKANSGAAPLARSDVIGCRL